MTSSYDRINTLEEFEMIAGTHFILTINVTDEDGLPVDITTGVNTWVLSPYGRPSVVVLTKTGTITGTSQYEIELELADTSGLSGKYIQQAVHYDFAGKEFRKQGLVTIIPRIA